MTDEETALRRLRDEWRAAVDRQSGLYCELLQFGREIGVAFSKQRINAMIGPPPPLPMGLKFLEGKVDEAA